MALFQRIKTPFAENDPEGEAPVPAGLRSAGGALRQQREALGLDLSDAARALRIKPAYLAAIEEGRPDRLPGPAYAIGFVRAYSDHLGLDSAEILRRFRLEAAGLDAKPDLSFPMPLGERSVPGGAMLLVALILAVCGYGTWYYLSTGERSRPERVTEVPAALLPPKPATPAPAPPKPAPPQPMAASATSAGPNGGPSPQPVSASAPPAAAEGAAVSAAAPAPVSPPATAATLAIPATPAATAAPVPPLPAAPVAAAPAAGVGQAAGPGPALGAQTGTPRTYGAIDGPARIVLRATADSWIQVRAADHTVLFTGLLKPGESYRVPDQPGLSLRAGNAGGLDAVVDGKPAPPLGPVGAVRNVLLDPQSLAAASPARN